MVELRAAGGGSGALGSWIGEVALLAIGEVDLFAGEMETRDVAPLRGVTRPVAPLMGVTRDVAPLIGEIGVPLGGMMGEVSSFGCVSPAPGLARSVMRTVSFFKGTPVVFDDGEGGGVGWVLLESLIFVNFLTEEAPP